MGCVACGSETVLVSVVRDDTTAVLGFEHHTFRCSGCHKIERSLVFTRHGRETETESLPINLAPAIVPASTVEAVAAAAPGMLKRAVAKLRGA